MRFKTDENLHPEVVSLLRSHGHDLCTVWDQGHQGKPDREVAEAIRREERVLVTLDSDFADIRTYPPNEYHGLIVCRLAVQSRANVVAVFERVVRWLDIHSLQGRLWLVEEGDIRIRGEDL